MPLARCVFLHGLGDHGARHGTLVRALAAAGLDTVVPDLRGHGLSGGLRGAFRSLDDLVADARWAMGLCGEPDLPWVVAGHSMGALVAARMARGLDPPPVATALLSPPFALGDPPGLIRHALARTLSLLLPRVAMATKIEPTRLSTLPQTWADWKTDPLIVKALPARAGLALLRGIREEARAPAPPGPVLVTVGGADEIVSPDAARSMAHRWGAEFLLLERSRHEVDLDVDGPELIRRVAAHLTSPLR